jgi:anti-anti-sigma regulatory factor
VVSQLLLLRRAGATLRLQRVNPALRRCLELLRLDKLFLVEATE